jgi:hypothetical protein
MITGRSPEEMSTAEPYAPVHRALQVAAATSVVAVGPIGAVWWLRSSGLMTSYVPGMLLGVALSFLAAYAGRAFWQTRPGSQHLLFSELMVWGFVHRWYTDRRLESARSVLGTMSQAQRRLQDGLTPERQRKLLEQLARAMDARDPKTHGHSRRVARYSWMIAMRMGLPREEVARVRTAAAVHDVGKFGTPLSILRKEGPLDNEEFAVMKRHPTDGAQLVSVLNDDPLTAMVRHHHERLDGTGYPDRLAGAEIPLGARIISVADTFDAITAHRPYRAARSHKEALNILMRESGKQLDPDVVRAFCGHYSGRRPLTFWTSLMTLPERALGQLGSGVGALAAATKVATLATLVGALAAGTAALTHPSAASSEEATRTASALAPGSSTAAAGTGSLPTLDPTRPGAGHTLRESATFVVGSGPSGTDPAGGGSPRSPGAPPAESPSPSDPSGTDRPEGSGGSSGGSGGGSGAGTGTPHEGSGGDESPLLKGTVGEVTGTVGGTVKGAGGTVGGTVKEVTGTAGGTVEGLGGAVGGTAGGTVKEVGGVVKELGKGAGEVTAPVTGGVGKAVEEVPAKVTEVKGKVGEVVGKLKL